MRKWIIHQSRDKSVSIMEVEIELVSAVEDPSVMWLPKGEYKAQVLEPVSLYEKSVQGPLVAPVWHSNGFFETSEQAWRVAEEQIRSRFERDLRKLGIGYTEQEIQQEILQIKEIKLK